MEATVVLSLPALLNFPHVDATLAKVATLSFYETDPFAATLDVEGVPWTFARELLATALVRPVGGAEVGHGDVKVARTANGGLVLGLSSPYGKAQVLLEAGRVAWFVAESDKAALGLRRPAYDVDDWIARIFAEPAT